MNTTTHPRPTPTEHPALTALADVVPACNWNEGISEPGDRCEVPAVWAARGHGNGVTRCGVVVLFCDEHLAATKARLLALWEQNCASTTTRPRRCVWCKRVVAGLDDLVWGVERIRP